MPSTELMILDLKRDQLKKWREDVINKFSQMSDAGIDDEGVFTVPMGFFKQLNEVIEEKVLG